MKFVGGKDIKLAETEMTLKNELLENGPEGVKEPLYPGKWMINMHKLLSTKESKFLIFWLESWCQELKFRDKEGGDAIKTEESQGYLDLTTL